jgi:hypothetical protein
MRLFEAPLVSESKSGDYNRKCWWGPAARLSLLSNQIKLLGTITGQTFGNWFQFAFFGHLLPLVSILNNRTDREDGELVEKGS